MRIPTSNFQGFADRVTPGLDNLLQVFRDRKQVQAEQRQFARQLALRRAQQDFTLRRDDQNREFRREVLANQRDLRLTVLGEQQDFQAEQGELNRDFQAEQNRLDRAVQTGQINARNSRTIANSQEDFRKEFQKFQENFFGDFGDFLDTANAQVEFDFDQNTGEKLIKVDGLGLNQQPMTLTEFRNQTQKTRQALDILNTVEAEKEQIRQTGEPAQGQDGTQFLPFDSFQDKLRQAIKTNNTNVIDNIIEGTVQPDDREIPEQTPTIRKFLSIPQKGIDFTDNTKNIFGTKIAGDFQSIDFVGVPKEIVDQNFKTILENEEFDVESRGSSQAGLETSQRRLRDRMETIQKNYNDLLAQFIEATEIEAEKIPKLRLVSENDEDFIPSDITTYFKTGDDTQPTKRSNSNDANSFNPLIGGTVFENNPQF